MYQFLTSSIFDRFDNIIFLDTETTGTDPTKDNIIELAFIHIDGRKRKIAYYDKFIKLKEGEEIEPGAFKVHGISKEYLEENGIERETVVASLRKMLSRPMTVILAYNAQFDIAMIHSLLSRYNSEEVLKYVSYIDVMSIYKDRHKYPWKLCNALDTYQCEEENTHRAIDDTKALKQLTEKLAEENDNICKYRNVFGFMPQYGKPEYKIPDVVYIPQKGNSSRYLYTFRWNRARQDKQETGTQVKLKEFTKSAKGEQNLCLNI